MRNLSPGPLHYYKMAKSGTIVLLRNILENTFHHMDQDLFCHTGHIYENKPVERIPAAISVRSCQDSSTYLLAYYTNVLAYLFTYAFTVATNGDLKPN